MLASINPLGERARGTRWRRTTAWYVAGSIAGGALVGTAAGALGALGARAGEPDPTLRAVLLASAAAVALVLDRGLAGLHLPTVRRQVDEDWLARYRGWVYGSGFGFQLGLGVVTIVTTSTVYLMLVCAALATDVSAGLVIGMVFGAARAIPLLRMGTVTDAARLRARLRTAAAMAPRVDLLARLCVVGLLVVGTLSAVVS